jgi:hypothetical protein
VRRRRADVLGLAVLASCVLLAAGCVGSDDAAAPPSTSQQTTTESSPESTQAPENKAARSYRELMARLPPFDEPASPEVASWRKATITASFRRCASSREAAEKTSFLAANRSVLNGAAVLPGARFVSEVTVAQRDGNGCPAESGPATYYTTYRTYRLPAGATPARVFAHYERELFGWFEAEITSCEHTYGQGPAYVAVRACNGKLRLSVRARAPVEPPPSAPLPARPFGAQYPTASNYLAAPEPNVYETDPGETCERVSGTDVPSIIVPPPPGVSAEVQGKQVVVHWSLGTVHGDCPPSELILSFPAPRASTIHQLVHTAAGVTRMRLLHGLPRPKKVTARTVSVDGPRSRGVAVLVRVSN